MKKKIRKTQRKKESNKRLHENCLLPFITPIIVDKYIKFDREEIYTLDKREGECENKENID